MSKSSSKCNFCNSSTHTEDRCHLNEIRKLTAATIGIGTGTGGVGGASLGGIVGGSVGVLGGPIGIFIGCMVGSLIGGLSGSIGGGMAGAFIGEKIVQHQAIKRENGEKIGNYIIVKQFSVGNPSVYLVYRDVEKNKFVCRVYNNIQAFKELIVVKPFEHRNIIKVVDYFPFKNQNCIVVPYYDGGDLGQLIKKQKQKPFPENFICDALYQIASGLKSIHDRKLIHRDIKPSNIFIDTKKDHPIFIIGGFEHTTPSDCSTESTAGTEDYMSPEMKRYKIFDHTSDIWALGCTISEMMTFKHYNFAFEMVAAAQEGKDFLLSLSKDMKANGYSDKLISLVLGMLNYNPEARTPLQTVIGISNALRPVSLKTEKIFPERNKCVVCYDRSPVHACVPCGHLVLCSLCYSTFKPTLCPVCNQQANDVIKIFM